MGMNIGGFNSFRNLGLLKKPIKTNPEGDIPKKEEQGLSTTGQNSEALTVSLDLLANANVNVINVPPKCMATHTYDSVEALINDLNGGKFKKGDIVILDRGRGVQKYEVLRNGRLKLK